MFKFFQIALLFLLPFTGFNQTAFLNVSKDKIEIGEPTTLTFTITHTQPLDSVLYTAHTNIILAKETRENSSAGFNKEYELEIYIETKDTLFKEKGKFYWQKKYTVTGWDSAYVILPEEKFILNDSTFYFNPSLIQITSPIAQANKAIYGLYEETIKDTNKQLSFYQKILKNIVWIILVALVFIALIIFLIIRYRRKNKNNNKVNPKSAREITIEKIDALESSKLYNKDLKEYYYQLSVIIRDFLTEHYGVKYREKTTEEIKIALAKNKISLDTIDTIIQLLQQSDMVKFAKSKPEEASIILITNKARQIVAEIAQIQIITPE